MLTMAPTTRAMLRNDATQSMRSSQRAKDIKRAKQSIGGKGRKHVSRSNDFWYTMCKNFKGGNYNTQGRFLNHVDSGELSIADKMTFSRKMKQYEAGKLDRTYKKRATKVGFPLTEYKMTKYLELRQRLFTSDHIGLSWAYMKDKAEEFNKQVDEPGFKASSQWLSNFFKRAECVGVKLHGEAGELNEETHTNLINTWKVNVLNPLIRKLNIRDPGLLYNADQTGLFYRKLPNMMYFKEKEAKKARGCKEMKAKDRLTLMVCMAANGDKCPLALVGKSARPHCFRLITGEPLIPYTHQDNAWFDVNITVWWVKHVFDPYHKMKWGVVPCIIILDNCPAHKGLDKQNIRDMHDIPKYIHIIFLPPNVTSKAQPADMGIIACLKIGYKNTMMKMLLDIMNYDGCYEDLNQQRLSLPRGCRGLSVGGKATIVDVMNILSMLWSQDSKYERKAALSSVG